jgi:hypothetical protein
MEDVDQLINTNSSEDGVKIPTWAYGVGAAGLAVLAGAGVSVYHYFTRKNLQIAAEQDAKARQAMANGTEDVISPRPNRDVKKKVRIQTPVSPREAAIAELMSSPRSPRSPRSPKSKITSPRPHSKSPVVEKPVHKSVEEVKAMEKTRTNRSGKAN